MAFDTARGRAAGGTHSGDGFCARRRKDTSGAEQCGLRSIIRSTVVWRGRGWTLAARRQTSRPAHQRGFPRGQGSRRAARAPVSLEKRACEPGRREPVYGHLHRQWRSGSWWSSVGYREVQQGWCRFSILKPLWFSTSCPECTGQVQPNRQRLPSRIDIPSPIAGRIPYPA